MKNEIEIFHNGLNIDLTAEIKKEHLAAQCHQELLKLRGNHFNFEKFAKSLQEFLGEQDDVKFAYNQEGRGTIIEVSNHETKEKLELNGPILYKPIFVARKFTPDKDTPTISTLKTVEAANILRQIFFPDAKPNQIPTT